MAPPKNERPPEAKRAKKECRIEDMSFSQEHGYTTIEGTSNCTDRWLHLSIYDDGQRFIGTERALIRGYAWRVMRTGAPNMRRVNVKYVTE